MGELVMTALAPHPPIIVPEVGGDDAAPAEATIDSMGRLARALRDAGTDTIVIISPHSTLYSDAIVVRTGGRHEGDLAEFGAGERVSFAGDNELAEAIVEEAVRLGAPAHLSGQRRLDHGIMVPMYFIRRELPTVRLVPVSMGLGPAEQLYSFGMGVATAVERVGRRVALVASGDLSHRLKPGAPAGYSPRGRDFDEALVDALRRVDVEAVAALDGSLAEEAGECGLRSVLMMLGALDGRTVGAQVLSYEGPFGVGYAVAMFKPGPAGSGENRLARLRAAREAEVSARRSGESVFVRLAREAVEAFVRRGQVIVPPSPLPDEMKGRAGVFCSIHRGRMLRGCIGTIEPVRANIAGEIIANAISAAVHDTRFDPIEADELDDLTYSVDVLSPPEPISGPEELDPKRYGVIVSSRGRRGLLLPDLDGIDTVEEQVSIARRKAGIGTGERVNLERFEVIRYE
ncbi:MAG: 3,4-dihydroxyphenylacetate 2,3-dioxygenase [Firmicutes bacterium ADurb.Bin506]|nr:MAG: 3,4-dihydroxyphenylacetate 2,3-dioxygenase [Firmicutes bacterium ADurb.Bin506]